MDRKYEFTAVLALTFLPIILALSSFISKIEIIELSYLMFTIFILKSSIQKRLNNSNETTN